MHAERGKDRNVTVPTSPPEHNTATIRLRDVVRLLVRGAPFALAVTAACVVAAIFVTRAMDPVYRASVSLIASQSAPRVSNVDIVVPPVVDAAVYQAAIYDGNVLREALERVAGRPLGEREVLERAESVRVTVASQQLSSLIRIEVRDGSPERAARLANAVADELLAWERNRSNRRFDTEATLLEAEVAAIDEELAGDGASAERAAELSSLRAQRVADLDRLRTLTADAVAVGLLEPLARAVPPEEAVGPRLVLNTAIALVLGLVLGYGLLLIVMASNPRAASREDVARLSGLPVLAEFPKRKGNADRLPDDATGWLRARLARVLPSAEPIVLVVAGFTSPRDAEGVAMALAESFARGGDATLLVDADLRGASSTHGLGLGSTGATSSTVYDDEHLGGNEARPQPMPVVVARKRGFDFLPARRGADHPVERLVQAFKTNVDSWRRTYQVVVVDAPPLLEYADALAVASYADGVVLCTAAGRSSRRDLESARELLAEQDAPVLGIVITQGRRGSGDAAATTPNPGPAEDGIRPRQARAHRRG